MIRLVVLFLFLQSTFLFAQSDFDAYLSNPAPKIVSKNPLRDVYLIEYVETNAVINKEEIDSLPPVLKGLCAYYAALAGSSCKNDSCKLTLALNLGKQGSDKHKTELIKWFTAKDKTVSSLLFNECFQPNYDSDVFSEINSLVFKVKKNRVDVHIWIMKYNRGDISHLHVLEKYIVKKKKIIPIQRSLSAF